eukprot:CAMPEP_0184713802 /NCGR_PEP_ID=MMETSP0314-20130426/4084_1 /TAXON_ID=38298 /ORGANISM="Rhodella maculata, Strain CCMP 736" /LENGTH=51 /DNA_ID=CAMNT_0027176547 /DNA_START=55 /DNA_END=207 /DNA_ORIENTATION=-
MNPSTFLITIPHSPGTSTPQKVPPGSPLRPHAMNRHPPGSYFRASRVGVKW